MSRKAKYFSEAQYRGRERGNTRGSSPGHRDPDEELAELDPAFISLLREAFDLLDPNASDKVEKNSIISALKYIGVDTSDVAFKILNGLQNFPDEVSFPQFANFVNVKKGNTKTKDGIQKIFDLIDDGEGKITVDSLAKVSTDLGDYLPKNEIKDAISQISKGKDFISSEEFYLVMTKH